MQDDIQKQPQAVPPAPAVEYDDDIATPEDIAAEKERRAKLRAERKARPVEEEKPSEYGEYNPEENAVDPYLDPDPTIPLVPFKETPFLSRGCRECPTSYVPISGTETRECGKMTVCNWLSNIHKPGGSIYGVVEVRFKNNRKDFFSLPDGLEVTEGDVVAVEGAPGHDIGIVSLTGELCRIQMRNKKIKPDSVKRLFRRAKPADIERWAETIAEEKAALVRTRQITDEMGLVMKINDVEFQGDHSKAIFYYTADDRVDFRALIRVLAEEFKVRVEMRQIGVRQEAGKVGGIGTCGRELCCCTWLTNFQSVTTNAAKMQQILPNPQKLAGQCGKLKCCLNFEYEVYADAMKQFPQQHTPIRFKKGLALYKKIDVLRGLMWYAYEGENQLYALTADSVKEIMEMNKRQEYPERLEDYQVELMSTSALEQESNADEFEQELRRMAESGSGVVGDDAPPARDQKGDQKGGRRDNRDNRDNRQGKPAQREQRGEQRTEQRRQDHPDRNQQKNNRQERVQPPKNAAPNKHADNQPRPAGNQQKNRPPDNNNRRRSDTRGGRDRG
ncbi:MAG: hypothetical protein IJU81_06405 [Bacteroidales bacterium]|nr:hypothetical protein [Bacteroidales bacterium]